jgi:nicotinate-nucleotide pyrophosphorylase (carboxylating)
MIVAGLEAAEEVFLTLDSQQQLEAFVSDGETVEAGKVIARMVGFADVLISAERVALNLLQRLSGIATLTNKYVKAVEGTGAQITDTRATTPGLRPLERYAVELGGGYNSRFGLDDGVVVTSNHISILGSVAGAVKSAKEKLGYLHKVAVDVSSENEVREAINAGADVLVIEDLGSKEFAELVAIARALSGAIAIECSGKITPADVREYAEAGAQLIRVEALTNAAPAANISFKVQPF